MLYFADITVRHMGQTLALDINLEVTKGEHWVLVGDDETGKGLLLEAIAGKVPVVAGKVNDTFLRQYRQENPVQSSRFMWQKPVSLVSSRHNFKSLSGSKEHYYQQRYNAADASDAMTVKQYLSEIEPFTDSPVWTLDKVVGVLDLQQTLNKELIKLSNGETKKVLLAAALLHNPVLLLLDNPLSGLDIQSRQTFNQLLTDVTRSGITVIMIASPEEIPDAITHVGIWNAGQKLAAMPKEQFTKKVQNIEKHSKLDETEIKSLLSATATSSFDIIVRMKNVTVKYGSITVIDKVSWEVRQGERWALLGHNGAGKSTLLSLIYGDNPQAYANRITLFDRRRGSGESIWDIKQHSGFVSPELFQFFPARISCSDVIESGFYDTMGLFEESTAAIRALVFRWMKVFGLESLHTEIFGNVTPVNQRLCLLARALVKNPTLLILDEPCHGFSVSQKKHFKHVINAICRNSNLTMIYVSHYQQEIPECVTKVLQLEKGKAVHPAPAHK